MNHPPIIGIGTANPSLRLTQEQSFCVTGYETERIRKIFLNSDIDFRHFYVEGSFNRNESPDELNLRYLRGAVHIGCRAIVNCLNSCGLSAEDVDCRLHLHWLRLPGRWQPPGCTHGFQEQRPESLYCRARVCRCGANTPTLD